MGLNDECHTHDHHDHDNEKKCQSSKLDSNYRIIINFLKILNLFRIFVRPIISCINMGIINDLC